MKNKLILIGLVLSLFSCSNETTEIIDIIDPIVADDVSLKIDALIQEGKVSDLFPENANMTYLQSEAFTFYINNMLEIRQDPANGKVIIRNLVPVDLVNVKITARFPNIDQEIIMYKLDKIKAHTLMTLDYPFDKEVKNFESISGKLIDLSSLKGTNPVMILDYVPGEDPLLQKLHNINVTWSLKFHDYDPNDVDTDENDWEENMTPKDLRRYTGLMINLAYLFQSPEFKAGMIAENLYDDNLLVQTEAQKLAILDRLLNIPRFNCGKVVHVSGLGGVPNTFGIAEHVLKNYLISNSNIGNIPVHEIGHMLGFGHTSNFTYAKPNSAGVNEGFVLISQRIADTFIQANSFPINKNNYYLEADILEAEE